MDNIYRQYIQTIMRQQFVYEVLLNTIHMISYCHHNRCCFLSLIKKILLLVDVGFRRHITINGQYIQIHSFISAVNITLARLLIFLKKF
jgi:hypothetical protein